MRRSLLTILCILMLLMAAAPVSAGEEPVEFSTFLSITSPKQYETVWSDLVPPEVTVTGRAEASNGIRDVVVESSAGKFSCGNATDFSCTVPVAEGNETITVTLIDNLGKTSEAVLHIHVNVDIPPPLWIYVIGTVRDIDGRPIPDATVRFESVLPLAWGPHPVTTGTAGDGGYLIESAFGYAQNVSVEKEGYLPLHREVVFENITNRLDLELEPEPPQTQTAPGFSAGMGVVALAGGLLLAVRAAGAGMKIAPLIAASAIFFFLWAVMPVTLASHGSIGSGSVIFLLSLVSLAGSVQFLRAMRHESPRWRRGIPFVAVCTALALWTGIVAWAVPYHLGDPAFQMMLLLPPAAALLLSSFPDDCRDRVRIPIVVVAVLGIISLFLALDAFLKFIPSPVPAPGVMEFVGPLYVLLLMPLVGLLLIVAGAACR